MKFDYKVKNEKGEIVSVKVLGFFKIGSLDKEYVMYSIMDDNPDSKMGAVLLGEVIRGEGNTIQILDLLEEEIDMVVEAYNEIATQIGGKLDG